MDAARPHPDDEVEKAVDAENGGGGGRESRADVVCDVVYVLALDEEVGDPESEKDEPLYGEGEHVDGAVLEHALSEHVAVWKAFA